MRRGLASLGIAILTWGCEPGSEHPPPAPSQPGEPEPGSRSDSSPLALRAASDGGHYLIGARPAEWPLPLHRMHDWIVDIELADDTSEIPTAIYFDGGMPSHGHGFVTQPRVTRNLGHGEFLVEGVKFHMPGEWVLQITVTSRDSSDQVTLPLVVEP